MQRMRHPDHGATHAYSDTEMQDLLKRGFVPEQEPSEAAEQTTEPPSEMRRGPGRPRKNVN